MKPMTGADVRRLARSGELTTQTSGLAPGFLQANLVVVPADLAFAFMLFCRRNPQPCPLLDVTEPGGFAPSAVAPDADLRTDFPRYRVYRDGVLTDEPTDLTAWWRDDMVAFLLGCSFTFETALLDAHIPVRHVEQGRNVPMYRTNIACKPSGLFRGPMVVSMRPLTPRHADEAAAICARYPLAHGAPIHRGDPRALGIADLDAPDFGDPVEIRPGEMPVFWACGVTPQAVAMSARPPLLLTHAPGHMLVTDVRDREVVDRWVL